MSALDIAAIRAAHPVSAVVGSSVKLKKSGHELVGSCPFHQEKSPSFYVNDAKGFYHCFGCGVHGDVLDFVQAVHGCGLVEAAERLGAGGSPPVLVPRPLDRETEPERDTTAEAITIWRAAGPAAGTPVQAYLASRGLLLPIPASIRFAQLRYGARGDTYPCLVALVASVENKAIGVQRTFLKQDGSGKADVPKPKLALGRVLGGAIRLAPAAAELTVAEGLEDGLTLQQETGKAVWVAAGASMLPSMRFPPGVRLINIGQDNDDAGTREAAKAAESFALDGRSVRVVRPLDGFKDFNAELQGVSA